MNNIKERIMENTFNPLDDETMESRLWDYIDGTLNGDDRTVIDRLVAGDQSWRAKYGELLELHRLMASSELEEPSMRFTKNVMEEIGRIQIRPATANYINKRVIWGIGSFFIAMIIGFVIYSAGLIEWSGGSVTNPEISKISNEINHIDYSPVFNSTSVMVFMMVNVILGLFFVDRYLANKRSRFVED